MSALARVPGWAMTLLWLLVVIVAIILVAMVVHALGGFSQDLHIGHFRLVIAVT